MRHHLDKQKACDMIPRYARPQMTEIWSEQSKFQIWFEIEAHACDAQADSVLFQISRRAGLEKGQFDIDRIDEIERNQHA